MISIYDEFILNVPDFPKAGVQFKDITPLLENGEAFQECILDMEYQIIKLQSEQGEVATKIIAPESRGFLFGAPLAYKMKKGLVVARKPGKLPRPGVKASYTLEYGTDTLEIPAGSLSSSDRVIIVDDLVATGGSAKALCQLVEYSGAKCIGMVSLINLPYLNGDRSLKYPLKSIVNYGCHIGDEVEFDATCIQLADQSFLLDFDQLRYSALLLGKVVDINNSYVTVTVEFDFKEIPIYVPHKEILHIRINDKLVPYRW